MQIQYPLLPRMTKAQMKIQKYKLRIYKHHLPRSAGRPGPGQFRDPGQRTKTPSFQKLFSFYKKRKLKSKA